MIACGSGLNGTEAAFAETMARDPTDNGSSTFPVMPEPIAKPRGHDRSRTRDPDGSAPTPRLRIG